MSLERVEVLKFGGTSVATPDAIANAAGATAMHAENQGIGIAVVSSAIAKTTDHLVDAERAALSPERDYRGIVYELAHRHSEVIDGIPDSRLARPLHQTLGQEIENLNKILESVRIKWDTSPATHDYIVSMGERIIAPVIAAYFREYGIDATSIPAEEVITTDGRYGSANPDIEGTRKNIRENVVPLMMDGKVVILGGYYGSYEKDGRKVVTTLDRGGSDRSATAFGEAMHGIIPVHDVYLLKNDVAGVMTADPRVVGMDVAQINPHMLYDELKALSGLGGKVVHARAVDHVQNINASLHLKNTENYQDQGTIIDGIVQEDEQPVKAVTFLDALHFVTVKGSAMDQTGILQCVTSGIKDADMGIRFVSQPGSEQVIYIALDPKGDISFLDEKLRTNLAAYLSTDSIRGIEYATTAIVGVVGVGVDNPFVKAQIYTGLQGTAELPINPKPGKESSGENEVSILINNDDGENAGNAVRRIHQVLFEAE